MIKGVYAKCLYEGALYPSWWSVIIARPRTLSTPQTPSLSLEYWQNFLPNEVFPFGLKRPRSILERFSFYIAVMVMTSTAAMGRLLESLSIATSHGASFSLIRAFPEKSIVNHVLFFICSFFFFFVLFSFLIAPGSNALKLREKTQGIAEESINNKLGTHHCIQVVQ